jgi:hypothetical protein
MKPRISIPETWSPEHSKAFLFVCAAGVDGFRRNELDAVVPFLERLGTDGAAARTAANDAFAHYHEHVAEDTVEDALVLHALEVKRRMGRADLRVLLSLLGDIALVDEAVSEGEHLVLTLLRELWELG